MGTTGPDGQLISSLPGKTGVYSFYSTKSGKFYIGSTTDFDARFNNHYSDSVKPGLSTRLLYIEVNKEG